MKLTAEEIETYRDMINGAEYALIKQVNSVSLQSNYGGIELLETEADKLENFLTNMLNSRVKKLTKEIEKAV